MQNKQKGALSFLLAEWLCCPALNVFIFSLWIARGGFVCAQKKGFLRKGAKKFKHSSEGVTKMKKKVKKNGRFHC